MEEMRYHRVSELELGICSGREEEWCTRDSLVYQSIDE